MSKIIKEYTDINLINCKIDKKRLRCMLRKKGEKGKGISIEDIDRIGASVGVIVDVSMISPKEVELFIMERFEGKNHTCIVHDWRDQRVLNCHLDEYWDENPPKG